LLLRLTHALSHPPPFTLHAPAPPRAPPPLPTRRSSDLSSVAAPRRSNAGEPSASNSSRSQPTPTPTVTRPRESTSPSGSASAGLDRKSTRLNSSHDQISYAVFCLKKKKIEKVR